MKPHLRRLSPELFHAAADLYQSRVSFPLNVGDKVVVRRRIPTWSDWSPSMDATIGYEGTVEAVKLDVSTPRALVVFTAPNTTVTENWWYPLAALRRVTPQVEQAADNTPAQCTPAVGVVYPTWHRDLVGCLVMTSERRLAFGSSAGLVHLTTPKGEGVMDNAFPDTSAWPVTVLASGLRGDDIAGKGFELLAERVEGLEAQQQEAVQRDQRIVELETTLKLRSEEIEAHRQEAMRRDQHAAELELIIKHRDQRIAELDNAFHSASRSSRLNSGDADFQRRQRRDMEAREAALRMAAARITGWECPLTMEGVREQVERLDKFKAEVQDHERWMGVLRASLVDVLEALGVPQMIADVGTDEFKKAVDRARTMASRIADLEAEVKVLHDKASSGWYWYEMIEADLQSSQEEIAAAQAALHTAGFEGDLAAQVAAATRKSTTPAAEGQHEATLLLLRAEAHRRRLKCETDDELHEATLAILDTSRKDYWMIGILLELFNVDAAYDDYRDTLVRRAQGQTKRLDALQEEATVLSPKREVKALREMLDEVKTARDKANLEVADLRVELGKAKTTAAERFESIEKLEGEVARGYEHQQHLARDLAAARTRVADLECLLRGHCESIDDLRTKLAASQESDTLARDVLSRIGHDLGLARGTDAVKVANAVEDALRLRDSSIGELRAQLDEALAPTAPCFTRGDKVKVIGAVAHIGAAAIEWQRSMLDKVGTVLELCLDGTVRVEFASEGAAWFPVATLELVGRPQARRPRP